MAVWGRCEGRGSSEGQKTARMKSPHANDDRCLWKYILRSYLCNRIWWHRPEIGKRVVHTGECAPECAPWCGYREHQVVKRVMWLPVLLHRRGYRERTAIVHGIASLVDRRHDAGQQQGEQIGMLLHWQGSRYCCQLAMMIVVAESLADQVCSWIHPKDTSRSRRLPLER